MKSYKLLSIIIPVYNVEKYIRQCLDSVIVPAELMEKLEVIVVNDGTPDNSAKIAHEYANRYSDTIYVIDKENGGHGSAWNVGLKMATGKYIRFLDSDDWLSNLTDFMVCLESINSDLIFTSLYKYYEGSHKNGLVNIKGVEYNKEYDTSSFSYLKTQNEYNIYDFWYCTYKTEMLQREYPLFVERVSYDDAILFLAPFILGRSMIFLDIPLYNYRLEREGQSVNQNTEKRRWMDYLKVCEGMIQFANSHSSINDNQRKQRDAVLTKYFNNRSGLFSMLSFPEYKQAMGRLLLICKDAPYIKLSPKLLLYKYTPSLISWHLSQFFNRYILSFITND